MATIVTEYRFLDPIDDDKMSAIARDLDPALARRGASWQRSYLSDDRLRLVCEFAGSDAESVAAAHREESIPYEAVYEAQRWTLEEMEQAHAHEQIQPAATGEESKKAAAPVSPRP
jgi:hypothetical protein